MNAVEIEDSGIPLARISAIEALPGFRLAVSWAEGSRAGRSDEVDLAPAINSYKIYRPLRNDEALFRTAYLIEGGDVVAWEGHGDLEMSADMIEALAEESMTPRDFAAFLQRNDLTQEAAAALLGRSRRQIGYYLSSGPIPRVVSLACHGYEARRRETRGSGSGQAA
jgi:hypothetical protein